MTLHTFLKGFFYISDTTLQRRFRREDPGARFSDFNLSYRLPFVRNYLSLYLDSISHDDVTPISAPRRAVLSNRAVSFAVSEAEEARYARRGCLDRSGG